MILQMKWGRILAALICLHLSVAASATPKAKSAEETYSLLLGSMHSLDQALLIFSGVSTTVEPVRAIADDLKKDSGGKNIPLRMTVKNSKLYTNDKNTGVEVVNYKPLTFQVKEATWTYNRAATLDQNYFELKKHLLKAQKLSARHGSPFLNQARAEEDPTPMERSVSGGGFGGAAGAGSAAYLIAAYITEDFGFAMKTAATSAVAGGIIGAAVGYWLETLHREDRAMAEATELSKVAPVCDREHGKTSLASSDPKYKARISVQVDKTTGKHLYELINGKGEKMDGISEATRMTIDKLHEICKKETDETMLATMTKVVTLYKAISTGTLQVPPATAPATGAK
jgi:hypothetical protein